jgi:hypothetical protein
MDTYKSRKLLLEFYPLEVFDLHFNHNLSNSSNDITLVDLIVPKDQYDGLKAYASQLPSIQIPPDSKRTITLIEQRSSNILNKMEVKYGT